MGNRHLDNAIFDIAKADALMYSIERAYLDFGVEPEERERMERGAYAFYALWDVIRKVADDLELLSGDCRVVDAIYAVNDVRRCKGTLKTED